MKTHSRTKNTIYNLISSIGGEFIAIVFKFIVRSVFIATLGKSYLGIEGLFGDILNTLSFAELGFSTAILFKLYKPIANNDKNRISALMRFYKRVYMCVAIAVLIFGLILIPLIPFLIKDYTRVCDLGINITLIYLLYLAQSVSSYMFFAYKNALIIAYQKQYIITLVGYIFIILFSVMQILCLIFLNNFVIYVILKILQTISLNICTAIISRKLFSDIWDIRGDKLEKAEILSIFKDCGALFLNRLNIIVVRSTDSLILSALMGLETVALYSNYNLIYLTLTSFSDKIFNAFVHSLGNLHSVDNTKHEYLIFEVIMFFAALYGAVTSIGFFLCADTFISLWIGDSWMVAQPFSLLFAIMIYNFSIRAALSKYRSSMGLFTQAYLRPVLGMIVNLAASLLFVHLFGIYGVLCGTICADFFTFMWLDPYIVHKYGFKNQYKVSKYYFKYIKNFIITFIIGCVLYYALFSLSGVIGLCIKIALCVIVVPLALMIFSYKTEESRYIISLLKRYFKHQK